MSDKLCSSYLLYIGEDIAHLSLYAIDIMGDLPVILQMPDWELVNTIQ